MNELQTLNDEIDGLEHTNVLLVDCQTTGSSPENGHLLELGWGQFNASMSLDTFEEFGIETRLIQIPEDAEIPPRISGLTGITSQDLDQAIPPEEAWDELLENLNDVQRTVAHYATFELRFLQDLSKSFGGGEHLEHTTICTHKLAKKLLGGLPRKGIEALAGYWGHPVPEKKRCRHHVLATAVIWKHLIRELEHEQQITDLDEFEQWYTDSDSPSSDGYSYPLPRKRRLSLPEKPGVYRMLDREDRVLYVGKATSLKDRVNSYFQSGSGLAERKLELVSQVHDINFTVMETPLEASLRESDEIKQHEPRYNSDLLPKDREIQYATENWNDFSDDFNDTYRVGPMDRIQPIYNLRTIREWIRSPSDTSSPEWGRLRRVYQSEPFNDALGEFLNKWNLRNKQDITHRLREISLELWNAEDTTNDEETEDETSDEWTTDRVL
ncbi:MAG: exonuclease domain-containing protein, partial [bacterium]